MREKFDKVVLAGGTVFPGYIGLPCYFGAGWKACATDLKDFSGTGKMRMVGSARFTFFLATDY